MGHRPYLDKLMDETRASQRNIVFPDTVRNGRSVDAFLWRGSPHPPLVQRIGAWMFGLVFMGLGLTWLAGTVSTHNKHDNAGVWITLAIGVPCFSLGVRIFRNGFSRRIKSPENSN